MWKLFGIAGGTKEGMIDFSSRIGLEPAERLVNLVGSVRNGIRQDMYAGQDPAGLEQRLRSGACPPFALERLEQVNEHPVI